MLNNTNISNLILLTDVFLTFDDPKFDDIWWSKKSKNDFR